MYATRSVYRGYFIDVFQEDGWSFTAQPTTPFLPILAHAIYSQHNSSAAALFDAKRRIDRLLAISLPPLPKRAATEVDAEAHS